MITEGEVKLGDLGLAMFSISQTEKLIGKYKYNR